MFYDRFLALCKVKEMAPSAVVEAIGINKANASFWKKGSMPSSANLQKLADFFEVPTDYLLGQSDSVTVDVKDEAVVYDTISKAEIEEDKILLGKLLQEIDTIPERHRGDAIHEIATIAKMILRRYKTLVPSDSFIGP